MGKLSTDFQKYLYDRYPAIYRRMDTEGLLYELTMAITDPAIPLIEKLERMTDLLDSSACPDDVVSYMLKNYGGEFYDGVDLSYQRKFLKCILDLLRTKGTYTCIRYLVAGLTGLDVTTSYSQGYTGDGLYERKLTLRLRADTLEKLNNMDNSIQVIRDFIKKQIPFFLTVEVTQEVVEIQSIGTTLYDYVMMTEYRHYDLM